MRFEERVLPTPERLAKGGIAANYDPDGRYLSCQPEQPTVLEWLADMRLISGKEFWAANHLAACKLAFECRSGARVASWQAPEDRLADPNPNLPNMADDYARIIREVSRQDCETALELYYERLPSELEDPSGAVAAKIKRWLYDRRGRIAEALGRLARAQSGDDENSACA